MTLEKEIPDAAASSEPVLSVVLPMFNEAEGVGRAISEVRRVLGALGHPYEIICVDDGSTDDTISRLVQLSKEFPEVRPVQLSRNFGKEAALAAGIDHARGAAVLFLDADLQHPPAVIPEMVAAWKKGADVVSGVKRSRGQESALYRSLSHLFYVLMGGAAGRSFHGASDFKLLDRQVVKALMACPERHRFFRGLVAWVGFRTVEVPFDVMPRAAGETKWSTWSLLRYSVRNLLSFSSLPLRAIAGLGAVTLCFGALLFAWTLFRWARGDSLAGFPTVILLQLIFGGLILFCLGIIALYLAEMYDELKRRPIYLCRVTDETTKRPD